MTHYDTEIIAYNSVIIVTGFADGRTAGSATSRTTVTGRSAGAMRRAAAGRDTRWAAAAPPGRTTCRTAGRAPVGPSLAPMRRWTFGRGQCQWTDRADTISKPSYYYDTVTIIRYYDRPGPGVS